METLANLESFVRSAELGSFSAAARRLGLTPAAVSRNVAQLEANLGVRLFQRSTRRVTLTEAGERFLHSVGGGLESIQLAIADLTSNREQPAGSLKVSVATAFGIDYLLPLMPEFMARYPAVTLDWQFDNRQVDLIAEGFDAAIGGGIELTQGLVARELAPAYRIAVAAPAFLKNRPRVRHPRQLIEWDGILIRSPQSGRVRKLVCCNAAGESEAVELKPRVIVTDPEAQCRAALLGLGVAVAPVPHLLPHLQSGSLVQLLPDWYVDAGPISLYFASGKLLPAKTRAFVDYLTGAFEQRGFAALFTARGASKK